MLPPEAQSKLLSALEPYRPGEPIAAGWSLGTVSLAGERATLELWRGESGPRARVVLLPRGSAAPAGAEPAGESASFSVFASGREGSDPALVLAIAALVERLRAGDAGGFHVEAGPPPAAAGAAPTAEEPPIPVSWTLLGGAAVSLLLLGLSLRNGPRPETADVALAFGLAALAWVLREALGPMTLLHENSRGAFELEVAAGLVPVERPMGGQLALARLLLGDAATVGGAARLGAAAGALQAGLAFLLARALALGRTPAFLAGAVVATLPVLVRMSASEDSYPAAVSLLLASAVAFARAARGDDGPAAALGFVLAGLAGVFRPETYVHAAPLAFGLFLLRPGGLAWLRSPWVWAGVAGYALVLAPDVPGILAQLGEGSALTPGWWNRQDLRAWPLVDPEVTPPWFLPAAALGLVLSRRRREAAWLALLAVAAAFVHSSDNGWPASLRYASTEAWPLALLAALLADRIPRPRAVLAAGVVLAASAPVLHADFVSRTYAQQGEVRFQETEVLPRLLGSAPGTIVTPWPALDRMSGTLLTLPLRARGFEIVPLEGGAAALRRGGRVYWYRGLACWARPVRGGREGEGLHPACEAFERDAPWRPEVLRDLEPASDADWIRLGDGRSPIEVGLFALADEASRSP